MYALFLYALPYWYRSANSICVVAMEAIHFSVCVASVAHTFLFLEEFEMKKKLTVAVVLLLVLVFSGCSLEKTEGKGNSNLEQVVSIYTEAVYEDDYSTYIDLMPDFCKRNIAKSLGLSGNVADTQIIKELEKIENEDNKDEQTIEVLSVRVLGQEDVNDFSQYSEFNEIFNDTVTTDDYQQIKEIAKMRVDLKIISSGEENVITKELTCVKIDNRWLVALSELITE